MGIGKKGELRRECPLSIPSQASEVRSSVEEFEFARCKSYKQVAPKEARLGPICAAAAGWGFLGQAGRQTDDALGVSTFMGSFLLVSVLSFRDSNRRIGISWKERRLRKNANQILGRKGVADKVEVGGKSPKEEAAAADA